MRAIRGFMISRVCPKPVGPVRRASVLLAEHGPGVQDIEDVEIDRDLEDAELEFLSTRPSSDVTAGSR